MWYVVNRSTNERAVVEYHRSADAHRKSGTNLKTGEVHIRYTNQRYTPKDPRPLDEPLWELSAELLSSPRRIDSSADSRSKQGQIRSPPANLEPDRSGFDNDATYGSPSGPVRDKRERAAPTTPGGGSP